MRSDVTRAGGGDSNARAVLERTVAPEHLYGRDRGLAKFALFKRIVAVGSSYVCRVRDNSVSPMVAERPLSEAGPCGSDPSYHVRATALLLPLFPRASPNRSGIAR
jgi:hypothetical protein